MAVDDDGFDFEWDVKDEEGLNVTERKLYDALLEWGLKPEAQYIISQMTVDFAFPDVKLAIEVNGPHHQAEYYKQADKRRYFVLNNLGWRRRTFSAKNVYNNPGKVAEKIGDLYLSLGGKHIEGIPEEFITKIYNEAAGDTRPWFMKLFFKK